MSGAQALRGAQTPGGAQTPRRDPPRPGGGAPFFLLSWLLITALLAGVALVSVRSSAGSLAVWGGGYSAGSTGDTDGFTLDDSTVDGQPGQVSTAAGGSDTSGGQGWAPDTPDSGSGASSESAPSVTSSSPSSTSPPSTTSGNGLTATGLPSQPAQRSVAETLVDHGEAINSSRYADAWALMSPALQDRSGSLDEWRSGVSSSQWTQLDIYRVTLNGDGTASVDTHLRTTQDPSEGDGYACLDWSLQYTMTGGGPSWHIDRASGESRPC